MGPHASYAYIALPWLALSAGGALEMTTVNGDIEKEKTLTPLGRIAVEPRWTIGHLTLRGAVGARAGVIFQTITRNDSAVLERGGYAGTTHDSAFVWGPEARLGVRWSTAPETSRALFVELEGGTSLSIFDESGTTRVIPGVTAGLGLGARF
jgi:hypothetical protein